MWICDLENQFEIKLLQKRQVLIKNCLKRILNIRLPEKISEQDLWDKTNQSPVDEELKKRQVEMDIAHTEKAK